jgi:quercetin dioxygenase-like cupin family protein
MRLERWDPRTDGPLTQAALTRKLEALGYRVSTLAWPASTILPAQALDSDRADAVVDGIVKLTLDGESVILTAGDVVCVPAGAVRRLEVVGSRIAHCLAGLKPPTARP